MIWDTHAHLDDRRYEDDLGEVRQRAKDAGLTRILNVGYDEESSVRSVELACKYPEIFAAVGVHPHDAAGATAATWDRLSELAREPKVLAWGEIGLDYYRELSPRPLQRQAFVQQIELAAAAGLPIIVHNRDAHEDAVRLVKENPPAYGGVFHCFSGSWEMAKTLLRLNFYISFAGPLTYKNARQAVEVAQNIPLDRFLVETDAPYLTPEPYRGKRNEPAHVRLVLSRFADIRGLSLEQAADLAMANAKRLFVRVSQA